MIKNIPFLIFYLFLTSCAVPITPLAIMSKSCNTNGYWGLENSETSVTKNYYFFGTDEEEILLRDHIKDDRENPYNCKDLSDLVIETEVTGTDYLWSLLPLSGKRTVKTYFKIKDDAQNATD